MKRRLPLHRPLFVAVGAAFALAACGALIGCIDADAPPKAPSDGPFAARPIRPKAGVNQGSSSAGCFDAFQPSLDPASDLQRLAAACGALSDGSRLVAVTPVHAGEAQNEESPEEELSFLGRAGRCYRVFSVGDPGVRDLDVAILDGEGRIAAADVSGDRFPVVPTTGSLCLHKDEPFTIHAAVTEGRGGYLMQVWGTPIK